jgi:hypothetical protein
MQNTVSERPRRMGHQRLTADARFLLDRRRFTYNPRASTLLVLSVMANLHAVILEFDWYSGEVRQPKIETRGRPRIHFSLTVALIKDQAA